MDKPSSPTVLATAAGISLPYASQILSGARLPAPMLAARIYRSTGWKPDNISSLSDAEIAGIEKLGVAA